MNIDQLSQRHTKYLACLLAVISGTGFAAEQEQAASDNTTRSATIEPTVVTAEKQPAAAKDVPISLTVLDQLTLAEAGVFQIKDAADYAPNVHMSEFTARKTSFPFVRGVGSGPINPSVTTYVDGVPQLHANSSSFELLGIERIEFLRGPQSSLYGRNTLGGAINIHSQRPRTDQWRFDAQGTFGNYDFQDYRFMATGPVVDNELGLSLGGGYSRRDGYTENTVTGNDLDSRDAWFARTGLLWKPTDQTEVRFNLYGEHARDGDFALGDLGMLRSSSHQVAHDFEGFTQRDLLSPSITLTHENDTIKFTSITGYVDWDTLDVTDLDATATPLATRSNREKMWQLTQEFRLGNTDDTPIELSDDVKMKWLVGVFMFHSEYDQTVTNSFSAFFPGGPFTGPSSAQLIDDGVGIFGQTVLTFWDKLDLTFGLRYDHEFKQADLFTGATLLTPMAINIDDSDDFGQVSPRIALSYDVTDHAMVYGSISKGFKAGGFNATAPAGSASYDEETSWTYETGVKTKWLDDRLAVNAALFYIDWNDVQLDQPNPANPLLFFVDNAGSAVSKGAEMEVVYRAAAGWDIFGSVGYTDAEFTDGSAALVGGALTRVDGNTLPFAPEFTWTAGTQVYFEPAAGWTAYGRAEVIGTGDFVYDASNAQQQDTYTVVNLRAGLRRDNCFAELWMRNAFDEQYVPLAIPSTLGAPSGYIGESGEPQVFGVTVGLQF